LLQLLFAIFPFEIKWWDWSEEKIKRNKKFFTTDLSELANVHELIAE